ncbi:MAG: peptidoglycan recognition protein family protein [Chloroflexaceae bacterium]
MTDFPTEGSPPFINRRLSLEEWQRYVATYDFGRLAPNRLVLHHTVRPDERSWNGLTTMRGMQRFYAGQGWPAGPHIFVAADGIWLATPMREIGVHAGVGNGSLAQGWYSIGLEMVGNFDTRLPGGAMWQHALAVMGELSRRLKIPPRTLISFHRDYTNLKSCPGWAVSKAWVWSQVEAYLAGVAPPPPPPPPPAPLPSDERLLEALLDQSYRCRAGSQGHNPAWAFHQYAVQQGLGMPVGPSVTEMIAGKRINYQPFARDTLFVEVPNWGDVQTLSALLGGSIPPAGLGRELLERTYRAGGSPFRPDWAFHQFAVINRLGPPIGTSAILNVDGSDRAYQVFAVDTLYSPTSNYADVRLLSHLAQAADGPALRLREALLAATYRKAGTTYRPDWAFHQLARSFNIGAPLCDSRRLEIEGAPFALQVYALDTLFNLAPNWSQVRRLRDLVALQRGAPPGSVSPTGAEPLGAAATTGVGATPTAPMVIPGDYAPPLTDGFQIVPFRPSSPAQAPRGGQRIQVIVLHALAGPLATTLARMTRPGARFATHYVVGVAGGIYQLVEESQAARHAGIVDLNARQVNVDAISIAIALERPAGWPAQPAGSTDIQVQALRWLLGNLGRRYRLGGEALLRWGSLAGSSENVLDGLPLAALREALEQRG